MSRQKFAIIDIETTGGSSKQDKITEIAIVLHDGFEIIDTWQHLINPERSIPYYITQITGINDEMVRRAPKFYEIAKELVTRTEDATFVAHNVRFDYGFFVQEFAQLGFTYSRPQLCTVQMSRRAFPGLKSYSLGNLTRHFNIALPNHHRAMDDAMATAELFQKIVHAPYFQKVYPILSRQNLKVQKLPQGIEQEFLDSIPNTHGLYYFYDSDGLILYVGKSIHLRKRIYDHFADHTERSARLQSAVSKIDYKTTGNELASLLFESYEIKLLNPLFNKAQKKKNFPYAIVWDSSKELWKQFQIVKTEEIGDLEALQLATLKKYAQMQIDYVLSEAGVCSCLRKQLDPAHCLKPALETCSPSLDLETSINEAKSVLMRGFQSDFVIMCPGRDRDEKFIVLIKGKVLKHMGYISNEEPITHLYQLEELLDEVPFNIEAAAIIRNYLKSGQDFQLFAIEQYGKLSRAIDFEHLFI
jgi:DNA polymerase-3 subunit epsilon